MKLDILAFAAHPDDVELSCAGTLIKAAKAGKKVGIVDLTQGELGSRGSAALRKEEAAKSSEILGLATRENLQMPDGFFGYTKENQLKLVEMIRKYQPAVVLANAVRDRHPDHGKGAHLVSHACFLSGLRKIETYHRGEMQDHFRPRAVYHYIQDYWIEPDFVVDVTEEWDTKMESILAYSSQFYDPKSTEPSTPISGEDFMDFLKSRAMQWGRPAGVKYAEGFTVERYPLVENIFDLG